MCCPHSERLFNLNVWLRCYYSVQECSTLWLCGTAKHIYKPCLQFSIAIRLHLGEPTFTDYYSSLSFYADFTKKVNTHVKFKGILKFRVVFLK